MLDARVLSVDPGLRGCGVALHAGDWQWETFAGNLAPRVTWRATELLAATWAEGAKYGRGPMAWAIAANAALEFIRACPPKPDGVILEAMQVRQGSHSGGDPADLLELTGVLGCLAARLIGAGIAQIAMRRPLTLPKSVLKTRLLHKSGPLNEHGASAALTIDEINRIAWPTARLQHNVLAAIGLGRAPLLRAAVWW